MYQVGDTVWLTAIYGRDKLISRRKAKIVGSSVKGKLQVEDLEPSKVYEIEEFEIDGYALTARDYKDAIQVQDASNLSGVLYSFAKVMHKIKAEEGSDSEFAATHPITILYLDKLVSLAHGYVNWSYQFGTVELYEKSYKLCRERAAAEPVGNPGV